MQAVLPGETCIDLDCRSYVAFRQLKFSSEETLKCAYWWFFSLHVVLVFSIWLYLISSDVHKIHTDSMCISLPAVCSVYRKKCERGTGCMTVDAQPLWRDNQHQLLECLWWEQQSDNPKRQPRESLRDTKRSTSKENEDVADGTIPCGSPRHPTLTPAS